MATITPAIHGSRLWVSRPQIRGFATGILFISPALIGLTIFTIWPMVQSLYFSFTDYNVLQPPFWIGWSNYQHLLKDRFFLTALGNTLIMVLVALPIHIIFDLAMAFLLNTKIRGLPIYRTIFYIPSITPVVASAIVWLWIFNGQYGILNVILHWFGIQPIGWLADPNWVKSATPVR